MAIYQLGDKKPVIPASCYISDEAVLIGSVILGENVSILPGAVLRADNVAVSIVCPGYVATGFSAKFRGGRPLEISAEEAARCIVRGLEKRRPVIAFPFVLAALTRLGMVMPGLRRAIVNRFFRVEVRSD